MILFSIFVVVAIVISIVFVIAAAIGGSIFVLVFGDAIVCVAAIVIIVKLLRRIVR